MTNNHRNEPPRPTPPTNQARMRQGAPAPQQMRPQQMPHPQTMQHSIDQQAQKKKGKRLTIIIVILCVVVAIAVWLAVWLFACNGTGLFDPNAQTGQAPYKTQEEIQAELNRTVEEGMFNISIASNILFEDGASSGTAYIENVPGNRYLMQVAITDDATGELLYESGVLQPNQFIEEIVLTRDLDPGIYDATATFTALDKTTYEEVGQAAAKITLNVQN